MPPAQSASEPVGWIFVGSIRQCSRSACRRSAVATLTYVYADSTAVLGPLALYAEPHSYDLCGDHAERLTVPRGWEVLRLALPETPPEPNPDDLLALANAVRQAAGDRSIGSAAGDRNTGSAAGTGRYGGAGDGDRRDTRESSGPLEPLPGATRRSHLRVLRGQ
jgi:hypothetical protein